MDIFSTEIENTITAYIAIGGLASIGGIVLDKRILREKWLFIVAVIFFIFLAFIAHYVSNPNLQSAFSSFSGTAIGAVAGGLLVAWWQWSKQLEIDKRQDERDKYLRCIYRAQTFDLFIELYHDLKRRKTSDIMVDPTLKNDMADFIESLNALKNADRYCELNFSEFNYILTITRRLRVIISECINSHTEADERAAKFKKNIADTCKEIFKYYNQLFNQTLDKKDLLPEHIDTMRDKYSFETRYQKGLSKNGD